MRTNQNAVLLLDEPEQNTFPFYTAHIAEIMAREVTNQYFITTHNQYRPVPELGQAGRSLNPDAFGGVLQR
ncbi:MAG: ATP-binding protein [Flavobacteriales bacterium]|nr:ATP-binding protein [Flavobacteriales bacterium]